MVFYFYSSQGARDIALHRFTTFIFPLSKNAEMKTVLHISILVLHGLTKRKLVMEKLLKYTKMFNIVHFCLIQTLLI